MINLYPLPEQAQRVFVAQRATLMYAEHKLATDAPRLLDELEGALLLRYAHASRAERNRIVARLHELRRQRRDLAAACDNIRQVM